MRKVSTPFGIDADKYQRMNALNGVQYLFYLANGIEVSVIRHDGSYGGKQGLWELWEVRAGACEIGWLTADEVANHLREIASR